MKQRKISILSPSRAIVSGKMLMIATILMDHWNRKRIPSDPRGHIPRHAFILWLAMRGRLATMDRPHVQRKVTVNACVLCGVQPETHTHLFFQCGYSSALWGHLSTKAGAICPFSQWDDILQWASSNFHHKKNFSHNLARYALSTSVYLTWQERNNRIFNNKHMAVSMMEGMKIIRIMMLNHNKPIPVRVHSEWKL